MQENKSCKESAHKVESLKSDRARSTPWHGFTGYTLLHTRGRGVTGLEWSGSTRLGQTCTDGDTHTHSKGYPEGQTSWWL
jgi:hypothetical protein